MGISLARIQQHGPQLGVTDQFVHDETRHKHGRRAAESSLPKLEEGGKKKDANQSNVALRRHTCIGGLGWRDAHIQADVEHGDTLSNRSPQERSSASQRVSHEQQEADTRHDLDNAVDARAEKRGRSAFDAKVAEDPRSIDVDGVGPFTQRRARLASH